MDKLKIIVFLNLVMAVLLFLKIKMIGTQLIKKLSIKVKIIIEMYLLE